MTARQRKLIGYLAVLAFLILYVGGVGWLGARLPPVKWLQFGFYCIAGMAWGLPLIPVFKWMNAGRLAGPQAPARGP